MYLLPCCFVGFSLDFTKYDIQVESVSNCSMCHLLGTTDFELNYNLTVVYKGKLGIITHSYAHYLNHFPPSCHLSLLKVT